MKATLTPDPVANCWALGVPSVVSARIDCSASGSTSGCAGSVGQMANGPFAAGWAGAAAGFVVEEVDGAGGVISTVRSGMTDATEGSCANAAAWAAVTVAENALPSEKCLTLVGAAPDRRPSTVSCAVKARARRGDMLCLLAGVLAS